MRGGDEALRVRRAVHWRQGCDPVAVAWGGRVPGIDLRLPAGLDHSLTCLLYLEDGKTVGWRVDLARLRVQESAQVEGRRHVRRGLTLPGRLPLGYHHLIVHAGRRDFETLIIAAPRRAYAPPDADSAARTWGVFLPLYALRSQRSWGSGDFSDLENLMAWVGGLGGGGGGAVGGRGGGRAAGARGGGAGGPRAGGGGPLSRPAIRGPSGRLRCL